MMNAPMLERITALTLLISLAACSGGGGDEAGPLPSSPTYTLGGTVTGMAGSTALRIRNAGEELAIGADGDFVFPTALQSGAGFNVTVETQPTDPWQSCSIGKGTGSVNGSDVTDIDVQCTTNSYTVGGSVNGLAGGSLTLQNNGGDDLVISADGNFQFSGSVSSGMRYDVSLLSTPTGQTCTLNNVAGVVAGENITTVAINCSAITYAIGGTVNGLLAPNSGLELINNATERLVIANNGAFNFTQRQVSGSAYNISIAVQPSNPAQTCQFLQNSDQGTVNNADVTSITVECLPANASGSLDPAFGNGGVILVDFESALGRDLRPAAVREPLTGKILVAGTTDAAASTDFGLFRLNADGTRDTGFNNASNNGFVRTDISPATSNSIDYAVAIARQSDGRLVVAGYTAAWDFALVRYEADGRIDTTFGTNGIVVTDINSVDRGQALAIQDDGKIIVVGYAQGVREDFAIVRYTSAGVPDPTFNGGDVANTTGAIRTDFNGYDRAQAVAIQPDGRIVVAGYANSGDFAVARYNTDGSLDTTFGPATTGKVMTNLGSIERAQALVLQATGELLLGGYTGNGPAANFALVRYTSAGELDTTFDVDGMVTTDLGANDDRIYSVALDAGGNIVVAGNSHNGINNDFALARYTASGALDTSFGIGGIVVMPVSGGEDIAYSVIVQPDGNIVAVGEAENGSNGANINIDFAAIRVIP